MAEPLIGEIKFFSFDWPPLNWVPCDGRLLQITANRALFSLIGTTFGGNGTTTFAVPDLRGRVPRHSTASAPQGTADGVENVALDVSQMPTHNHVVTASSAAGTEEIYQNALFAAAYIGSTAADLYAMPGSTLSLNSNTVSSTGGSQPHPNCQPSLVGNYCMAIKGVFPGADNPSQGEMSSPLIGEIRPFAGSSAPANWALCDGSLLSIAEYNALYSLIGTTYGGSQSSFALPDLRGRLPVGQGAGPGMTPRTLGQQFGTDTVTLTEQQLPEHNHDFVATTAAAASESPANALFADAGFDNVYIPAPANPVLKTMNSQTVASAGTNQPHDNIMSSLAMNYIICLFGTYPQQS